jgi:hypothetical protein
VIRELVICCLGYQVNRKSGGRLSVQQDEVTIFCDVTTFILTSADNMLRCIIRI